MKTILIFLSVLLCLSCNKQQKEFANIKKGMNKSDVVAIAGEPTKKNNVGIAELWTYDSADRTIVFRKDTVYNIITSSEARIDSLQDQMKDVGAKIEEGAKETSKDIQEGTKKLSDKADTLLKR